MTNSNLDRELAHALLRFALGVNMFIHGAIRLFGNMPGFVQGTVKSFGDTFLPEPMVLMVAYLIPVAEFAIGLGLIFGLMTRWALVGGALLMALLMFGMGVRQEWGTVGTQLGYSVAFFLLLYFNAPNRFSLDGVLGREPRNQ